VKQPFFSYLLISTTLITLSTGEFRANTETTNDQSAPALATDSNGNFIIAWSSYAQDGDSGGIFAQRFDANYSPLGDEFQINTTTGGNQTSPDLAADSAGNFIVVWHGPGSNQEDIFAQRFDCDGQAIGSEFGVNDDPNGRDLHPKVSMSKTGTFVIVWENNQIVAQSEIWQILYKIYDSNAVPIAAGKVNLLSQSRYPDVAIDGNNNFTVVWVQNDIYHSSNLIMSCQYYDNGIEKTSPWQVNTTGLNSLTQSSITMDGSGHFIVAWDGHPDSANEDNIYARRYKFDATPLTGELLVNTTTAGAQQHPKAAMNNKREFVIVWNSESPAGSNIRDIFVQRYDSLSAPVGDEFRVNTYVANDQKYPVVALKENNEFLTVWQSYGQDGSGYGIFADTGPKTASADINNDGLVNFFDYLFLSNQWLEQLNPLTADLIDDNKIDRFDLAAFCQQWLTESYQNTEVDINTDSRIDFRDYNFFAHNWLKQGPNLVGDITGNGIVDMTDLQALMFHWGKSWE
jgi:hypothetical protein